MPKLPISVHILTWNSALTLEKTMKSVDQCAEILVLDGGSVDNTIAIAEAAGARILPQRLPGVQGKPLTDFAAARNIGLQHATELWVLCLDSDEQMEPTAMKEIEDIVLKKKTPVAFLVPRHYVLHDGTIVQYASTYPNERIYFFHRDAIEQWEKPVHEHVRLKPGFTAQHLQYGSLAPLPPLSVFYAKLGQYLTIETQLARGSSMSDWLRRVLHTLRGRTIATLRLLRIWLIPREGARLPLRYEWVRYWYAWKLIILTFPPLARATTLPRSQLS